MGLGKRIGIFMEAIAQIFNVRLRILYNKLKNAHRHSTLKIIVVWCMIIGLFAGMFYVPYRAFVFLESMGYLGVVIIDRLLYLFFMGLLVMLVFSNCIICYSTNYISKETEFFFTLPIRHSGIFFIKFVDSIILSSWAFLCFLVPILSAYAVVRKMEWEFYASLIVFFIPFAIIAGAVGCLITMFIIRFLPRESVKIIGIGIGALFVLGCVLLGLEGKAAYQTENETVFLLTKFIPQFGFSQNAFTPNFWICEGLFKVIASSYKESLFWWLLLLSNAFFLGHITHVFSKIIYYNGWAKREISEHRTYGEKGGNILEKVLNLIPGIPVSTRGLIVKDIKIFWRDPLQWSQFTVFFGLLAIYFANIRNLGYESIIPFWKNIISFLNLSATNLTLASLSVRFVFPQISLEGKRFWILGLAPLEKHELLFEKFLVNSLSALGVTLPLILLSNWMLRVSSQLMILSAVIVVLMCFSLVALCVGLGAVFPNFKEDNPAQIVSGFGGTLALVLSLAYITVSIMSLALPYHLLITEQINKHIFDRLIIGAGVFVFSLSFLTIFCSLFSANRALQRLEL